MLFNGGVSAAKVQDCGTGRKFVIAFELKVSEGFECNRFEDARLAAMERRERCV
jgi:hypothetical protein